MSNRANAMRYGGSSGGRRPSVNPMPGGFGTSGGITIDPVTGEPTYAPMTVGHPVLDKIFNRGGASAAAQQYNNVVMQMMLQDAMQRKSRLAEVEATTKGQKEVAGKTGEENRKSDEFKQRLDWMTKHDLPHTTENFQRADAILSGQTTENEYWKKANEHTVLTDPRFQQAQVEGATAAARQPVFGNVLAVPADTDVYAPGNLFPSQPTSVLGRTVQQGMVESAPTEYNGMQMPGKPFAVRQVQPGSFNQPPDPALFDAVMQRRQQQQPGQPTTQPSVNPDYNAKAADFMQQFNFGTPQMSNDALLNDPNVLMMMLGGRAFGR